MDLLLDVHALNDEARLPLDVHTLIETLDRFGRFLRE